MRLKIVSAFLVCVIILTSGMAWAESEGWGGPKVRIWRDKTTAPGVNDDVNKGHRIGDLWPVSGASVYICLGTTQGAANWQAIDNSSGSGGGVALSDNNVWTGTNRFNSGVSALSGVSMISGVTVDNLWITNTIKNSAQVRSSGARAGVTCYAIYDSAGVTRFAVFENGKMVSTNWNITADGDINMHTADNSNAYLKMGSGAVSVLTYATNQYNLPRAAGGFAIGTYPLIVGDHYIISSNYPSIFPAGAIVALDGIVAGWKSGVSPMAGVTSYVQIASGVSPPATPPVGGPELYAVTGSLWVADVDGTNTQLSPHDPETGEWYHNEFNAYTGKGYRFYPLRSEKVDYTVTKLNPEMVHRNNWKGDWKRVYKEINHQDATEEQAETAAVAQFAFDWTRMPKYVRQAWGK